MESSTSYAEWKAGTLAVKAAHGGTYPAWWFPRMLQSGLAERILNRFGETAEMKITRF